MGTSGERLPDLERHPRMVWAIAEIRARGMSATAGPHDDPPADKRIAKYYTDQTELITKNKRKRLYEPLIELGHLHLLEVGLGPVSRSPGLTPLKARLDSRKILDSNRRFPYIERTKRAASNGSQSQDRQ